MAACTSRLERDSIMLPDPAREDIDTDDFCCEELSNLIGFLVITGTGKIRNDRLIEVDFNTMAHSEFWVTDCGRSRKVIFRACPFCSTRFQKKRRGD